MTDKTLPNTCRSACKKRYFLLPKVERQILDAALEHQPSQPDPILVGGSSLLKTVLQLMSAHRLKIEGIDDAKIVYIRWIESVQVRGEHQEVYLTFSPRFKRIWTPSKDAGFAIMVESTPASRGTGGQRERCAHYSQPQMPCAMV